MRFPHDDRFWQSVLSFLLTRFGENALIVAPLEFIDLISGTFPYDVIRYLNLEDMDAIVIHKDRLNEVGLRACDVLSKCGIQLFGNEVFVVFSLNRPRRWPVKGKRHFDAFYR